MFERFTERARQVVVLAQEEARSLKHHYIGTEHILLGLLREQEGLAARVLQELGVTLEPARAQIARSVGAGEEESPGQIPFTPRAKKVLELALREAKSLGHGQIGTEHILLGLVREGDGLASRILLLHFGVDSERVRNAVIRALPGSGPPPRAVVARERPGGAREEAAPAGRHGGQLMALLEREIRARLHREPDNGDLLVILSELPEGVVARALADLGIGAPSLDAALERARAAAPDDIEAQLEQVRRAKDEALDSGRLEEAVRRRERERALQAAAEAEAELLARVRARLKLSEPEAQPPDR
jgi:hypothetical protein